MILPDQVVEILSLADPDTGLPLSVIAPDGRLVGPALIDGDLLRHPAAADSLLRKAPGGPVITAGGE